MKDVRFICVLTGGRILGLGDIGTNSMGIPVGKLQLYTACTAVPPDCCLPVLLDIGTTNAAMRADPLYLGLREAPPETTELDTIVDEFVAAANEVFPGVCVPVEDSKGTDAIRMLERYGDKYLVYNDDIHGTASVTIAGLTTALQIKNENLKDQRVFFLGAGSAGIGISKMIVEAMVDEGLERVDAVKRIALFDVGGLVEPSRHDLSPSQKVYAHAGDTPTKDLAGAVDAFKPTVLIGVSTTRGAFTENVVRAMAKHVERRSSSRYRTQPTRPSARQSRPLLGQIAKRWSPAACSFQLSRWTARRSTLGRPTTSTSFRRSASPFTRRTRAHHRQDVHHRRQGLG